MSDQKVVLVTRGVDVGLEPGGLRAGNKRRIELRGDCNQIEHGRNSRPSHDASCHDLSSCHLLVQTRYAANPSARDTLPT